MAAGTRGWTLQSSEWRRKVQLAQRGEGRVWTTAEAILGSAEKRVGQPRGRWVRNKESDTGTHQTTYPPKLGHDDEYPVGIDLYEDFCVYAVKDASLLSGRDGGRWRRSVGRSRSDRSDGRQAGRACEVEIGAVE